MKLLHTSDLHLGKCLLEESLYQDQKYILDEYSMYTALRFNKITKELALKTYNIDHEFLGIKLFC